jgi:hypothetical protein
LLDSFHFRKALFRRIGALASSEVRYWLAEKESLWRSDPIWRLQQQREALEGLER